MEELPPFYAKAKSCEEKLQGVLAKFHEVSRTDEKNENNNDSFTKAEFIKCIRECTF